MIPTIHKSWVRYLNPFFQVLELLGCLLGTFLGFLSCLEQPGTPKNVQKLKVFEVFANSVFWVLEAPDDHLGIILGPVSSVILESTVFEACQSSDQLNLK